MATDERFTLVPDAITDRLRKLASEVSLPPSIQPGDATRAGIESLLREARGTARSMASLGRIRFTGEGVTGSSADLEGVAMLSTAWQRAITATGAALEGVQAVRGRLPAGIQLRTRLVLTASPTPGSVIFTVEPKQSPLMETEPDGQPALTPQLADRPLADRASDALVDLLATTAGGGLEVADALSAQLRDLGPRVGSAVNHLARAIHTSNITLEVTWQEPSVPTRRAVVTPGQARFISEIVEGRGLDAVEDTLTGALRTISDSQQWLLDLGEEAVKLDASELPEAELRRWNVHDLVEVDVRIAMQERPDGRMTKHYTILRLREASGPPTLYEHDEL